MRTLLTTLAGGTALALAMAAPAAAHVATSVSEAPAGAYAKFELQVLHGCDDAATNRVEVQIPGGVYSVTPQVVPGWTITMTREQLPEPVDDGHGGRYTERVATVAWEGGPLDPAHLEEFGLSLRMPDTPGERALFPTVQTCVDGSESAWIDSDPAADLPAPAIALTEATGGHGADHGASEEEETAEEVTAEEVTAEEQEAAAVSAMADEEATATAEAGGDDGVEPLSVVALVVGGLGLAVGGYAAVAARRS